MRLGLDLALCRRLTTGPSQVNPATLAASGLWVGSYGGSPWVGTASTGASSGRNLTTTGGDVAPTVGSAVSTYTPASLNGTTQSATDVVNTAENYITTTAYTVSTMINPTAAAADAGVPYNNPGMLARWSLFTMRISCA